MNIIYQNNRITTLADTLAELIAELQLDGVHTIFELNGQIIAPGDDLNLPLTPDAEVNAFRIVAGG